MRIGYTTGVFDMLHVGHVNLLKRARSLCDYLIVGVASDALSIARKNKAPVQNAHDRMSVVAELRSVDKVVLQSVFDNIADQEVYRFDLLFKGDDWKGHPDWVDLESKLGARGVKIVFLPYTKGISSTRLREVYKE